MNGFDLIRKFITENPTLKSKKEIARQMLEKYPDKFKSLELARSSVRSVTGANGERDRSGNISPEIQKFFYNGFEKWATENLN